MGRRLLLITAFVVVLGSAGCSNEPYRTARVSGLVTLNGQPIANAAVMFQPVAAEGNYSPGPGSTGITGPDGRYTLKLVGKENPGAVVGKHKVRITMYESPSDPGKERPKRADPAMKIPAKYNDREGKVEFDVPANGTTSADFPLTSP